MPLLRELIVFEVLGHTDIDNALRWADLIAQLRDWFAKGAVQAPQRQVLSMPTPDGTDASLLIMPAWIPGQTFGVKVVSFFPDNAQKGLPTINAGYMLFDGKTGQMSAVLDGDALTARRTAAASALGADYLARKNAKTLLVVGTGQLALSVAQAHATVRQYDQISVWGRTFTKAQAIASSLADMGLPAQAVENLETACRSADVISAVTASTQPIILGEWLRPGTHLDLIGAFKSDMRESDSQAITQADLFVDNLAGAFLAGDLAVPLNEGLITEKHVQADLFQLCRDDHAGRTSDDALTVFKSVGMALEDLAAAQLAMDQTISG